MSSDLQELFKLMKLQTEAINNLAASNQQVIALLTDVVSGMADEEIDVHEDSAVYLDGSRR